MQLKLEIAPRVVECNVSCDHAMGEYFRRWLDEIIQVFSVQ